MSRYPTAMLFLVAALGCSGGYRYEQASRELKDLDTGDWEIQVVQAEHAIMGRPAYLFAVRGAERRRLDHVDDLARLIVGIRDEEQVREFYRLVSSSLELKGSSGRTLYSGEWSRVLHDRNVPVIPRVARHENGFVILRVVMEAGTDAPILVEEHLRPGSYRWEKIRAIEPPE